MVKLKWNESEIDYLLKNYSSTHIEELCVHLNRGISAIRNKASLLRISKDKDFISDNMAIKKRLYGVDEQYFSNIDTPEKAYWYGFIWADGNVQRNALTIALHPKDTIILENFKRCIASGHPIINVPQNNTNKLTITSKVLARDLVSLNITPQKTYDDHIPIIGEEYKLFFLLGLFDGDGCFTTRKWSICCRPIMANWIVEILHSIGVSKNYVYIRNIKNKENVNVNIHRKSEILKIYKNFYNSSVSIFYLQRKKDKIYSYIKEYI
jgi:hypothetical protein